MKASDEKKQKILIVDDSEMNRAILADMLGERFDIVEAAEGEHAIEIIRNHQDELALVLLDIVMPVVDGFDVLAVMNNQRWIEDIPVIMISAESTTNLMEKAYDLGVSDYISRPFDAKIVKRRAENTIMLYAKQKRLVGMVADQIYEKEKNSSLMVEILSNIVEFRNGESGLHVIHIHTLTELLLRRVIQKTDRYGLSYSDITMIANASALHDIGKIAIPEEILNKPGRLTPEEFEIMKHHSMEGAQMLKSIPLRQQEPLLKVAHDICRWHHERYDGRGYPDGLKGDDIPIAAQIVSLADVYDALTSVRVYKPAYSHEQALEMIHTGQCGSFNPLLLECLDEISNQLRETLEASAKGRHLQVDMRTITDEIVRTRESSVTRQAMKLVDYERTKYHFFASVAQEIRFEYSTFPDMLVFSEWGAKELGLGTIIMEPRENDELHRLLDDEQIDRFDRLMRGTSPEMPLAQMPMTLLDGRKGTALARSMWANEDDAMVYVGTIGKFVLEESSETAQQLDWEQITMKDALTGLVSYGAAHKQMNLLMEENPDKEYILAVVDMDNFRRVNEEYGHITGDRILKLAAQRLKSCIRGSDIAARIGGDEMMVLMEKGSEPLQQIKRVFLTLAQSYDEIHFTISVGAALCPEDARDFPTLLHDALCALREAKEMEGQSFTLYHESMDQGAAVLSPFDVEKKAE